MADSLLRVRAGQAEPVDEVLSGVSHGGAVHMETGRSGEPHFQVTVTQPQGGAQAYGDAEAQALSQWDHEAHHDPDNLLEEADAEPHHGHSRPYQLLTVLGLVALAVLTLVFDADIGFTSLTIGLLLALIAPNLQKRATGQITWPEILLICGVSTYVAVMEEMGTIDYVGHSVAGLASPLVAALLLCLIGAIVSAFASSTAACSGRSFRWPCRSFRAARV